MRPKFGREGGLDWGSFRATAFLRPGNKSGLQQQHHEAESNYSMDESDLIEYASQHLPFGCGIFLMIPEKER